MVISRSLVALLTCAALCASAHVAAQDKAPRTDHDLREHLIWNSPWQGRSVTPPGLYSYRMVFRQRRDYFVAEVTSLSTYQQSSSVVTIREGALNWNDSAGAEVNVALGNTGELVGTARSPERELPIILKPDRQ